MGLLVLRMSLGCSNILVSNDASADGSTQIAYNADDGSSYGSLGHYPARHNGHGKMREVWSWDDSVYLGSIPEANQTYNVVGNINEHGLIIGETTFGGLPMLDGRNTTHIIDYGSLIWITLQRARTAREAIHMMDDLCNTYGYASDGESFSIADPNEIWLMELIGKGPEKGAVWVASKVPDGFIGSTANQARTTTFAQNDPDNVLFAKDVVTFAQDKGLYPKTAKPEDFSFNAVYDPPTFAGVRLGEARVWSIFNSVTDGMDKYLDYAQGYNLKNPMPLFVKPRTKLSVNDTMTLMREHNENSWFDNRGLSRPDVGAGSGHSAYRWRPLVWESNGEHYVNERTVGTQQTSWTFVAQSRSWMPPAIGTLIWFAPDDSSTALRVPIYGGATRIPASFGDPVGQDPNAAVSYGVKADAYTMNLNSAFWVWNLVGNMAYGERAQEAYSLILQHIHRIQNRLFSDVEKVDKIASDMYKTSPALAIGYVTDFGVTTGDSVTKEWLQVWMELFSRFRDGFTVNKAKAKKCDRSKHEVKNCTFRVVPTMTESGYTKDWYARIVADSDNAKHYKVPTSEFKDSERSHLSRRKVLRMDKKRLNLHSSLRN